MTPNLAQGQQLEYKKAMCSLLLEQGATYREIGELLGISKMTIAGVSKGRIKTNPQLTAAIKKTEHDQLSQIGLISRSVISKRLLKALEDVNDETPLSQILKAQEIAFQQRRTLEGEASIIYDHGAVTERIEARRARLDELMAQRKEILLKEGKDGVHSVDAGDR